MVFTLYADGAATTYTVTLDGTVDTTVPTTTGGYESEAWKATFINLPKYQPGTTTPIVYTIAETTGWLGYTASTTDPVASGETITNTQDTTGITATKVWDDANDQDGIRPDSVTFILYADDAATTYTVTLDGTADTTVPTTTGGYESEAWIAAFINLPKYKIVNNAAVEIAYTVQEQTTAVITGTDGPGTYAYEITGNMTDGFTVTNKHTPELVNINGLKIWDDADDQDMIRPESIEITLMRKIKGSTDEPVKVEAADVQTTYPSGATFTNPIVVTVDDDFKWSFENLPRYMNVTNTDGTITHGVELEYSFSEATITYPNVFEAGYAVQYAKTEFQQPVVDPDTGDVTNGYWTVTVTNTHEPEAIPFSLYKYGQVAEDGQIQPDTKPLKGAVFTLYTDEACTDVAEMIVVDENGDYSKVPAIATSDEKGFVDFGQINFKLTLVTDDTVDPPVLVSVTTEAQTYYMKETLGDDLKDSYWDNTTIYEVVATPRVLNADGTVKTEASVTISVLKDEPTDAEGNVYTGVLTTGETIVIGETPDGLPIEVTADKIDNDLVHYEIRLVKIDHTDETKTKPVVGAQFDLYRAPDTDTEPGTDNAAEPDDTANDDEEAPVSLTLPTVETVSGYEKLNTKTLYTGNDGKLDLGDLLLGTYYLVETKAPDGYYKLDDPVEIIVKKGRIEVNYKIKTFADGKSDVKEVTTEYPQDPGKVPTIEVTIEDMPKYGNLTIVKKLISFELSEDATFVFTVVGKIDGETVYSNVATLTCSKDFPSGLLSTTLNYIPAGAEVTVTESYSGSHYVRTSEADKTIVIKANDTVSVDFTNDYTPEEKGGHGIVNTFEPDDSELGWHWGGSNVSSTPDKPAALPPAPVTGDEEENGEGPEGENPGDTPEE